MLIFLQLYAPRLIAARFPEIKEKGKGHFAEYFLIGTLTSVGLGLVGGPLLRDMLARL